MNRNYSWKKKEDIEIDLADLLCRLCRQWKQAVVCALVFAVFAGGYGYLKNSNDISVPVRKDAELTDDELWSARDAVRLAKETDELEEYAMNSILMQINPYQKNRIVLLYSIEEATDRNLLKIVESYLVFLMNGGLTEVLTEDNNRKWNVDGRYLSELIRAWQRTEGAAHITMDAAEDDRTEPALLYIEVTGKDAGMAQELASDIQDALDGYCESVRKICGKHKLSFVSQTQSTVIDTDLRSKQYETMEKLKTGLSSLKNMTDAFSAGQRSFYEDASGRINEEKEEALEENADKDVSVKYLILGFIAGVFAYCALYALWYVLHDTVKSKGEFQSYYSIPLYGSISLKRGLRNQKLEDKQKHLREQAVTRISLSCRHLEISSLCLLAEFVPEGYMREHLEKLAEQIQEQGINTVLAVPDGTGLSKWDMIAEAGTVLLVCKTGVTTYGMIDEKMEFCQENDIPVMGAVLLEGKQNKNKDK